MSYLEFFALLYGLPMACLTIIAVVALGCAAGTAQASIESENGRKKKPAEPAPEPDGI